MAANEDKPEHSSRRPLPTGGLLKLNHETLFFKVTEIARMTARAVHPCDEESPSFAYLQTVHYHIDLIDQAVARGDLRLVNPTTLTVLSPADVRKTIGGGSQCMVGRDDLVAFAASLGIAVEVPATERESAQVTRAKPMQTQHKEQVLSAIRALGYNPKKLPKREPGKSGAKSKVKEELKTMSKRVFGKAWQSLRDDGEIAEG